MGRFLKEYWIFIFGPFAAVLIGAAILLFMNSGDAGGNFLYDLF